MPSLAGFRYPKHRSMDPANGFAAEFMGLTRRSCKRKLKSFGAIYHHPQPFQILFRNNVMLDTLITSRTRIRLLLKFFSNSRTTGYLRALADEFGESTNAVRIELKRFKEAGLITSIDNGNKRFYRANRDHALYPELKSITRKSLGISQIEGMVERLGNVQLAMITGDYARGHDTGIIDLVIVGSVDQTYLNLLVKKAETLINRKIRTLLITAEEFDGFRERFTEDKALYLWRKK